MKLSYEKVREILEDDNGRPCLNLPAISFFEAILKSTTTILETGSGRSTIWFARQVKKIISFENKEEWYHGVTDKLKEEGLNNAIVHYDPNYPTDSFTKVNGEFDIVFLDGSDNSGDRIVCMKVGYRFVKPGGYLVVDDTQRPSYREGMEVLNNLDWPREDFCDCGYMSEISKRCSVWKRPK